jgi:outer membrane receptor protein involved in Fe transport
MIGFQLNGFPGDYLPAPRHNDSVNRRRTAMPLMPLLGVMASVLSPASRAFEDTPPLVTLPETRVAAPVNRFDNLAVRGSRPWHTYDQTDLAVAHERTVEEVLQGEPGFSVTKTDGEGISNLHLRGIGGQGLLSLDGIPILDSLPGITHLDAVLPDGLQSVEVDRGFAPVSQSFSALGGAIRAISRTARDDGGDVRIEGGSFGSLRETLRGTLAGKTAGIAVMANRSDVFEGRWVAPEREGNPERDPARATQVLGRTDWAINNALTWEGSLLYRQNWSGWDRNGINRGRLTKIDDPAAFFREDVWLAQNALTAQLGEHWLSRWRVGFTQTQNQINVADLQLGYKTRLYLARWENDQQIWQGRQHDSLHLAWGVEGRYESGSGPSYTQIGPGRFLEGAQLRDDRHQQSGFLEVRYHADRLSGDIGVRHEAYSRYADQMLYHAGVSWQWLPSFKINANTGNGFRIPGYAERLFPLIGKPGLKPERGVGGDLGLVWEPAPGLDLNLTGFYHHYADLIAITWNPAPVPGRPCAGECLFNIDQVRVAGLETGARYRFNAQWLSGLTYTWNDSQNLDTGGRVPFESLHTLRVFGEWQPFHPVSLWMEGIYRDRSWNDIGNTVRIDGNFRVNARLDYRFSERLNFYVRGENLTGNRTPHIISLDQTGAAVFGGVMLQFK